MPIFTVADPPRQGETHTAAVARRLRGELGQLNMSVSEVARQTGLSQPALSRRVNGTLPFHTGELETICETVGLSWDYLLTGIRQTP
jgi:transcriptional regulator with XRE-family HTH domain